MWTQAGGLETRLAETSICFFSQVSNYACSNWQMRLLSHTTCMFACTYFGIHVYLPWSKYRLFLSFQTMMSVKWCDLAPLALIMDLPSNLVKLLSFALKAHYVNLSWAYIYGNHNDGKTYMVTVFRGLNNIWYKDSKVAAKYSRVRRLLLLLVFCCVAMLECGFDFIL